MNRMSVDELKEIEYRLDFLSFLKESKSEIIPQDIDTELESLTEKLKKAYKIARINELDLKLVSL